MRYDTALQGRRHATIHTLKQLYQTKKKRREEKERKIKIKIHHKRGGNKSYFMF